MDWLTPYSTVITLLALVAGAVVYIYGTIKKGRSDVVRQDNADLRASNQDKVSQIAGLEATVTEQKKMIANLQEVATQTPAVTQLLESSARQQTITNKQHSEVVKQLSDLTKKIADMATEFSKASKVMMANTTAQDRNRVSRDNQ